MPSKPISPAQRRVLEALEQGGRLQVGGESCYIFDAQGFFDWQPKWGDVLDLAGRGLLALGPEGWCLGRAVLAAEEREGEEG